MNRAKNSVAVLFAIIFVFGTVNIASAVTFDLNKEQKEEYYKRKRQTSPTYPDQ